MSGARRLYLDTGPGETRGVVTLDGRPERLLIERGDEIAVQATGAVVVARVRRIERGFGSAFLDLGEGPDAVLALSGDAAKLAQGASVEIEITAAARRGNDLADATKGAILDDKALQEKLLVATTQLYTKVTNDHLLKAYAQAHPRAGAAPDRP